MMLLCFHMRVIWRQVLDGLKDGNAALKKMHDLVSIDEIERIMDETQEGIEKQKVSVIEIVRAMILSAVVLFSMFVKYATYPWSCHLGCF